MTFGSRADVQRTESIQTRFITRAIMAIARRIKQFSIALVVISLVVAGAGQTDEGQAAGVTFAGEESGSVVSQAEQPLIINSSAGLKEVTGNPKRWIAKVSGDRTKFRFVADVYVGDYYKIHMNLTNLAGSALNGRMTLEGASQLDVEVNSNESDEFRVARSSLRSWNFRIQPEDGDDRFTVEIIVAIPASAQPGFYQIDVTIAPAEV